MARRFWSVFGRALMVLALVGLLAAAGPARAQAPALVSVSPEYQLAHLGDTFSVQVRIDEVEALYGFDVLLSFPPELLEALSVSDADFLAPGTGWAFIDNDAGTIWVVHAQLNPTEPVSGSGTLFTVVFQADAEGATAALALSSVTLSDREGYQISCDTQDGRARLGDYLLFLPIALR